MVNIGFSRQITLTAFEYQGNCLSLSSFNPSVLQLFRCTQCVKCYVCHRDYFTTIIGTCCQFRAPIKRIPGCPLQLMSTAIIFASYRIERFRLIRSEWDVLSRDESFLFQAVFFGSTAKFSPLRQARCALVSGQCRGDLRRSRSFQSLAPCGSRRQCGDRP